MPGDVPAGDDRQPDHKPGEYLFARGAERPVLKYEEKQRDHNRRGYPYLQAVPAHSELRGDDPRQILALVEMNRCCAQHFHARRRQQATHGHVRGNREEHQNHQRLEVTTSNPDHAAAAAAGGQRHADAEQESADDICDPRAACRRIGGARQIHHARPVERVGPATATAMASSHMRMRPSRRR